MSKGGCAYTNIGKWLTGGINMENQRMKIPDTIQELYAIWDGEELIDEARIFSCRSCKKRGWFKDLLGVQYTPNDRQPIYDDYWYYCYSCMDVATWQFIIDNDIDIRILNKGETQVIQQAYYDGRYDKWYEEREPS